MRAVLIALWTAVVLAVLATVAADGEVLIASVLGFALGLVVCVARARLVLGGDRDPRRG